MTVLQAIYQLLFGPLELFFEVVYGVAFFLKLYTASLFIS